METTQHDRLRRCITSRLARAEANALSVAEEGARDTAAIVGAEIGLDRAPVLAVA